MKKSMHNDIIVWARTLSDEELEKEYYDAVYDSLGSQAEKMCELDYDALDIREQEDRERFLNEKSGLLELICKERGIELWKRKQLKIQKEKKYGKQEGKEYF